METLSHQNQVYIFLLNFTLLILTLIGQGHDEGKLFSFIDLQAYQPLLIRRKNTTHSKRTFNV